MKWLVTGGAGFIGANFVRYLLRERPDVEIVNLDLLTYAGNLENLEGVMEDPRHTFVRGDVVRPDTWADQVGNRPDVVVHFAAESHVDRSIDDPTPFLRTNVIGTQMMLDWARKAGVPRYVQVSTDEVYGTLGPDDAPFTERSPIAPNSPYAASKASADLLVRAAVETHKMDCVITRCSNNYGPYQFPEKFLPLMISNLVDDKEIPIYGDGMQIRDWIHVDDHARAILMAAEKGRAGGVYNVGGEAERTNISTAKLILSLLDKPVSLLKHVVDRKGHDRRYAIDNAYTREALGWAPQVDVADGMRATVDWYVKNRPWWERVKSGAYQDYYERMYAARLADGREVGSGEAPAIG